MPLTKMGEFVYRPKNKIRRLILVPKFIFLILVLQACSSAPLISSSGSNSAAGERRLSSGEMLGILDGKTLVFKTDYQVTNPFWVRRFLELELFFVVASSRVEGVFKQQDRYREFAVFPNLMTELGGRFIGQAEANSLILSMSGAARKREYIFGIEAEDNSLNIPEQQGRGFPGTLQIYIRSDRSLRCVLQQIDPLNPSEEVTFISSLCSLLSGPPTWLRAS